MLLVVQRFFFSWSILKMIFNLWPSPGGLNAGYSWPGVFLLGASGRTGRFFTQLLFHNPHSLSVLAFSSILLYTRQLGVGKHFRGLQPKARWNISAFDNWKHSFINWLPRVKRIKIFQCVCHHCTNKRSLRNVN